MNLSKNFSLEECLKSSTADKTPKIKKEQYNPPEFVIDNLTYVVNEVAQPLRQIINYPIKISSGWRCPSLNKEVGGSITSQHLVGEALDLQIKDDYLTDDNTKSARDRVNVLVKKHTDKELREDINANFYLFAITCLNMDAFDIDQVIHEYGEDGMPHWTHVSASKEKNKRQILIINESGTKELSLKEALELGV
jgi:hypothetical protein